MKTNEDYYNDPSQWGESQYISLKDIVDAYIGGLVPGDATFNMSRSMVRRKARNAIKMYNFSVAKELTSLEMDLSSSLQVTLPLDYADYHKISWVDSGGNKYEMARNENLSIAQGILQDHNYQFIYDHSGALLTTAGSRPSVADVISTLATINTDRSKIFIDGDFNIDKDAGIIQFGSSAKEKTIVLDYVSDGLYNKEDADIKITGHAFEAINDRIYFKLIERNLEVPQSEKDRARRALKISENKLMSMLNPVRIEDFMQVEKAKSRQVKQS